MIENSEENLDVYNTKTSTAAVWIGLYRVPGAWSDNSSSLFRNWLFMPDMDGDEMCVAETFIKNWDADDCNNTHPFICQGQGDYLPQHKETTVFYCFEFNSKHVSLFVIMFP